MGNIIFNVAEFICENPVIQNVTWSGIRYIFDTDWTSQGNYYSSFDPTTNMELSMDIIEVSNSNIVFSGVIDNSVPFNAIDYQFDVLDFYPGFSDKYQITLKLKITNQGCDNTGTYIVPITYP